MSGICSRDVFLFVFLFLLYIYIVVLLIGVLRANVINIALIAVTILVVNIYRH